MDALLLHYAVQYTVTCGLGLAHLLHAELLYAVASCIGIGLWFAGGRFDAAQQEESISSETPRCPGFERHAPLLGLLFLIGYFAAVIANVGVSATVSDDALMYHLPIPAIWLRDHQLTFFATWFSNPANSYSPLAVETFITWLMAPVGNDILAHFVQVPGVILIYLAAVVALEAIGVKRTVAVVLVIAALLSRPFISQSILVKDDLFVATFFMVIIAACRKDLLQDRFGPWRLGIAAGLFLATKYTALQSAPVLLLLIDAPFRAAWKRKEWVIALSITMLFAGPWYLRNVIVTGNPLYPVPLSIGGVQIFKGLFFPSPSTEMHTLAGIWKTLTGGYQGLSPVLMIVLLIGAALGMLLTARRMLREPLLRTCVAGSFVGLILFFAASHAPELRYAYPGLLLVFLGAAVALSLITFLGCVNIAGAAILAGFCIFTGFGAAPQLVVVFLITGLFAAAIGFAVMRLKPRSQLAAGAVAMLIASAWVYVYWKSIVSDARSLVFPSLSVVYGDLAPAWEAAAASAAPGETIAYANLALIRPVMGFEYEHPIVYVPARPGVRQPHDLPTSDAHLAEPQFRPYIAKLLSDAADKPLWLKQLTQSGATVLIIGTPAYAPEPVELRFASESPAEFVPIFKSSAATVFRVAR